MKKIFCDFCKEEGTPSIYDRRIILEDGYLRLKSYDLCEKCLNSIFKHIETLKK